MVRTALRVSQGFGGTREHWQNIEGNKGTLANFWEQGNKIRKITVRKHSENVWEHGNIGQFWKGTREQGPPLGDPKHSPPIHRRGRLASKQVLEFFGITWINKLRVFSL